MRDKIRKVDEEKQKMCDTLSRIEANYKVAFRDQGVQDLKVKDLEEQLEQRSQFEHQLITKLEDLSEKYKAQNTLLKEVDLINLEMKKENEELTESYQKEKRRND